MCRSSVILCLLSWLILFVFFGQLQKPLAKFRAFCSHFLLYLCQLFLCLCLDQVLEHDVVARLPPSFQFFRVLLILELFTAILSVILSHFLFTSLVAYFFITDFLICLFIFLLFILLALGLFDDGGGSLFAVNVKWLILKATLILVFTFI